MRVNSISDTIYISDLDGTLLNENSQLSDESVALLNEAISLGANITIATARTPATVSELLKDVNLKLPAIVMTGAALWNKATHEYENVQYLDSSIVCKLKDVYCQEKLPVFIYTLKNNLIEIFHLGHISKQEERFVNERAKTVFKRFHSPCMSDIEVGNLENVMLFYAMQPSENVARTFNRVRTISKINPVFYHDIFGPEIGILEVFSNTASKADAVKYLKDRFKFKRVVVFGDNVNDLPMMNIATHSVAVENAIEEVRNVANEVIDRNSENAVAKWILNDVRTMICNK